MRRSHLLYLLTIGICISLPGCGHGTADIDAANQSIQSQDLHDLPLPADVEAGTWRKLQDALAEELILQDALRRASMAPTGSKARVWVEFEAGDPGQPLISWYYANPGDYDQNGLVGISDITPLGVHFGEADDSQLPGGILASIEDGQPTVPFGYRNAASVVDGDGNGQIGIADVTPIGQGFNGQVEGYKVYAGTDISEYPSGNADSSVLQPIGTVLLADSTGTTATERRRFSFEIPLGEEGKSYWVRPFSGNTEGTPSRVGGAKLQSSGGALSLTGIEPASAQPGEIVRLQFSESLPDDLSGLTVALDDGIEIPLDQLAVSGSRADFSAPLLPQGVVSFTVRDGALLLGSADLTILAAQTSVTPEQFAAALEGASAGLTDVFAGLLPQLQLVSGVDDETAMAELAELQTALQLLAESVMEKLNEASPADRQLILTWYENSGFLAMLESMGAAIRTPSGKSVSVVSYNNWTMLSLDVWSAAIGNSSLAVDAFGVGAMVASGGTAAAAALYAKMFISIVNNVILTFIPTDLDDIRLAKSVTQRGLSPGFDQNMALEGRFCAQKNAGEGSIDIFVDTAINAIPAPEAAKGALKTAIVTELSQKLGGLFGKKLWGQTLSVVDLGNDPCAGHVGPYWWPLDTLLYEDDSWTAMRGKVMIDDYFAWYKIYPTEAVQPGNISVEPAFAHVNTSRFALDSIHFDFSDRYVVTVRAFAFKETVPLLFWSWQSAIGFSRQFPFWVGRYGDWKTEKILERPDMNVNMELMEFGGEPVLIYSDVDGLQRQLWMARPTDEGSWTKVMIDGQLGDGFILGAGYLGGSPAVLLPGGSQGRLRVFDGQAWQAQDVPGSVPGDVKMFYDAGGSPGYFVKGKLGQGDGWYSAIEDTLNPGEWLTFYIGDDGPLSPYSGRYQPTLWIDGNVAWIEPIAPNVQDPDGSIIYHRASAADGSSWADRRIVRDSSEFLHAFRDMGGFPGVLYNTTQLVNNEESPFNPEFVVLATLNFSYADSAEGLAWSAPAAIMTAMPNANDSFISYASIGLAGSRPMASANLGGTGLVVVEALDGNGQNWNTPEPLAIRYADKTAVVSYKGGPAVIYNYHTDSMDSIYIAVPDLPPLNLN